MRRGWWVSIWALVSVVLVAALSPASAAWTAFNDMAWQSGQTNYRITRLSLIDDADHDTNGQLVSYSDGLTNGVFVTFSVTQTGGFSTVVAPLSGSPADLLFSGKVDMARSVSAPASAIATIAVTGLVPSEKYRLTIFGNRGNPPDQPANYSLRSTKMTLSGADSFVNASTAAAVSGASNETTEIVVGTNVTGQIFDYTDIAPGSDGTLVLTVTGGAGNPYSWYLNTMRVELQAASITGMAPTVLYTNGASWKYYDTGSLPASDWTSRTYNDGSWSNGAAPLGYGETNPATVTTLSYGTNSATKWPTYYFRKHFTITNAATVPGLVATLLYDDGAMVYINGTRVYTTTNMCDPADNDSWANFSADEPLVYTTFTISPTVLSSGDNVVAVEVHQDLPLSSDVSLDMTLATTSYVTTNQPGGGVTDWQVLPAESWIAYNDLAWSSGQSEIRVSRYSFVDDSVHDLAGPLVCFDSGKTCTVTVAFSAGTMTPAINGVTNAGAPAGWTPADLLFAGKADMNQWMFFGMAQTGTITFAGMDPVRRYKIVLFGNRAEPTYTGRSTVVTLGGADSFTNESTAGAFVSGVQNETTRIVTGINTAGLVFCYSDIAPGSDGQVQLGVSGLGSAGNSAYLNTMLVELLPTDGAFADRDADGMDDEWEFTVFGSSGWAGAGADDDADGDGVSNYQEYRAGTDPTAASSLLAVTGLVSNGPNGAVLRWASEAGKSYTIQQTSNLLASWSTLQTRIAATPPLNVYTSSTSTNTAFWRVRMDGAGVVTVTMPISRMVFQRNNANQAVIPIEGQCPAEATRIDARLVARQVGWGTTTSWTTLSPSPANGYFSGTLTGLGGWYDLDLKAFAGSTEIAATTLERVGVGEVFITAGHSVAQGDDAHEANLYATDDRVNTVASLEEDASVVNMYGKEIDPRYLPMSFSQFGSHVMPLTSGRGPYLWAPFAQYIAQTQNVPVLILNTAAGGSTLNWYALSSRGLTYGPSIHNAWMRLPYGRIYSVIERYIKLLGLRAILSDNGTNDATLDPSEDNVLNNYKIWVEQARKDLNFPQLAIVVNRQTPHTVDTNTMTITGSWPHIRNAQERMIQEPYCFAGPDYDTMAFSDRYDGTHLSQSGQATAGLMWANALSNQFFSASTPYLPDY